MLQLWFSSMNLQGAAKFAAAAEGSFVVSLCQSALRVLPKHSHSDVFFQALQCNSADVVTFLLERPTQNLGLL